MSDSSDSAAKLLGRAVALLEQISREGNGEYPAAISEVTLRHVDGWLAAYELHRALVNLNVNTTLLAYQLTVPCVTGEVSA